MLENIGPFLSPRVRLQAAWLLILPLLFPVSAYGGEKQKGGGLFGAGMQVLDTVLDAGSGETDQASINNTLGEAQSQLADIVAVPLTAKEREALGKASHDAIRREFPGKVGAASRSRDKVLVTVWNRLAVSDPNNRFSLFVVERDTANAFCHVGGYIYIYRGLLDKLAGNPDALAYILGHEAAHVLNGDTDRTFEIVKGSGGILPGAGDIGKFLYKNIFTAYGQRREFDADERGMELAVKAGYSRNRAIRAFDVFADDQAPATATGVGTLARVIDQHFSTHPPDAERRARLQTGH